MADLKIDLETFHKRCKLLQSQLNADESVFETKPDALLFVIGSSDEENPYQKSTIIHNWLLGYEFPATLLAFTKEKIVMITSGNKAKYLSGVEKLFSGEFSIWSRSKDVEANKKLFEDLIALVKEAGPTVGIPANDSYQGKFINEWTPLWKPEEFTIVDSSLGLSKLLESKDDAEIALLKDSSGVADKFMATLADEMVAVIDSNARVSHSKLSERIENKIDESKFLKKLGVDASGLDWAYSPIIQSGGKYDLKVSARSNNESIASSGVVTASVGIRYKNYCCNLARSFLIDPSEEVTKDYDFMLELQQHAVTLLKEGSTGGSVYTSILEYVASKRPDLSGSFVKNVGSLIGLEFRDQAFVLNARNERVIKKNDAFNLSLGFNKNGHALILADTVIVGETNVILTDYTKVRSKVSFYFEDETKAPAPVPKENKILKSKLRAEVKSEDNQEYIRKENQRRLHENMQKAGLLRYSAEDATDGSEKKVVFKKYESYVRETQIPVKDCKIHVDAKNSTIILPIYGRPVPFHINSYKNGSKSEEGGWCYLRLNFNSPGAGSRKEDFPDEEEHEFVRSLTLRSKDIERFNHIFKQITDLKKDSQKLEAEKKLLADVVQQDKLIENKQGRTKRLDQIFIRPAPDTKRVPGTVFIHENGLRYQSPLGSKMDILFSNVKHLFFQPCKDEMIVIIHVRLKNPILMGKKKILDVQFYREATDMAADETNGKRKFRRYGDEDELEQEQEERRKRAALDKEFRYFAEAISDASRVDLDIPFRELGFQGVPNRSAVLCMPTRDCLVQLTEPPFSIVTLDEVEICILERVQFGLKNFDMVFVYKDFSKPVTHINTIPIEELDVIKSWLTNVDIPYTVSTINLNWGTIMKSLQEDPHQFFVDGGWSFLATGSDDENSEEEEEEESEYEASDDDPSDESVSSAEENSEGDYSGSDFSGSGSEEEEEEEEEGEDWDELERKAAKADRHSGFND